MKLLFDANISFKVASRVRKYFEISLHVSDTTLIPPAKDDEIWAFAKENNFVIVTYDEDFTDLINIYGSPPKVIWLRFGNASINEIINKIEIHLLEIQKFELDAESEILEIY
jgi:predicted nuclease of predicted toxin-antitoxin system